MIKSHTEGTSILPDVSIEKNPLFCFMEALLQLDFAAFVGFFPLFLCENAVVRTQHGFACSQRHRMEYFDSLGPNQRK